MKHEAFFLAWNKTYYTPLTIFAFLHVKNGTYPIDLTDMMAALELAEGYVVWCLPSNCNPWPVEEGNNNTCACINKF